MITYQELNKKIIEEMEKVKWQRELLHDSANYKTQKEKLYNDGIIEGMDFMITIMKRRLNIIEGIED